MRRCALASAICALGLIATADTASADSVEFKPPNDTVGHVYTTNINDGYSSYRGDVFSVTADTLLTSVGLYHDLTNIDVSYRISEVFFTFGLVNSGAVELRSGTANVTTSGLQFIDFSFAGLTLQAGHDYHVEFGFAGNGNQNFFYNNANAPFTQGNFQFIDGTVGGSAGDSVMPAIRLNLPDAPTATPLPGAATAGLTLMLGIALARRRRAAVTR
jgi:hypothetical protein